MFSAKSVFVLAILLVLMVCANTDPITPEEAADMAAKMAKVIFKDDQHVIACDKYCGDNSRAMECCGENGYSPSYINNFGCISGAAYCQPYGPVELKA